MSAPPPEPSAVLDALGDPTRRAVLRGVAERGPVTATELAESLPVTRQAVAKHLDVLRTAGLVASARTGRDVRFRLEAAPLDEAATWMQAVGAGWDRRLDALRERVGGARTVPGSVDR